MEETSASLPELEHGRRQAVATPEGRQRDVARELVIEPTVRLLQDLAARDRLALGRRPGRQLTLPRTTGEVAGGHVVGNR